MDATATQATTSSQGGAPPCVDAAPSETGPVLALLKASGRNKDMTLSQIAPGADGSIVLAGKGGGTLVSWADSKASTVAFMAVLRSSGAIDFLSIDSGVPRIAVNSAGEIGVATIEGNAVLVHIFAPDDLSTPLFTESCYDMNQPGITIADLDIAASATDFSLTFAFNELGQAADIRCARAGDLSTSNAGTSTVILRNLRDAPQLSYIESAFGLGLRITGEGDVVCGEAATGASCASWSGSSWIRGGSLGFGHPTPLSTTALGTLLAGGGLQTPSILFLGDVDAATNVLSQPNSVGLLASLTERDGVVALAATKENQGDIITVSASSLSDPKELLFGTDTVSAVGAYASGSSVVVGATFHSATQIDCVHLIPAQADLGDSFVARLPLPSQPYGSQP